MQVCASPHPYMYFYNPLPFSDNGVFSIDTNKRVCMETCPSFVSGSLSAPNCSVAPTSGASGCSYDITFEQNGSISGNTAPSSNSFLGYDSVAQVSRVCVPSLVTVTNGFQTFFNSSSAEPSSLESIFDQGYLADFTSDIANNWEWLLCGAGFAIVLSFTYMFLLRCFVGCIVWISLIGTLFLLVGLGVIFLYNAGLFGDPFT